VFQSPSLRGSGRFDALPRPRKPSLSSFNPLHCGAVVASRARQGGSQGAARGFQSPSLRGSGRFGRSPRRAARRRGCFNPLHCGAVVASGRPGRLPGVDARVSIPFIAGQWSLPAALLAGAVGTARFNPLHCGAVVASRGARRRMRRRRLVSIPFIAGQWSLHVGASAPRPRAFLFQSPSLRGSGRFQTPTPPARGGGRRVSIPFIAGQWSLLAWQARVSPDKKKFQSPSLRGSGRFAWQVRATPIKKKSFNPLHCGAVVASYE